MSSGSRQRPGRRLGEAGRSRAGHGRQPVKSQKESQGGESGGEPGYMGICSKNLTTDAWGW